MNTNEKIAEAMGWKLNKRPIDGIIEIYDLYHKIGEVGDMGKDTPIGNWLAKLIQAQLVREGWYIYIRFTKKTIKIKATKTRMADICIMQKHPETPLSEPAAIVALAKKIWGIE